MPDREEYAVPWIGNPHEKRKPTEGLALAETTDPQIRKLYGPKGEVLRTFSNRPPCGFHQGQRS